MIRTYKVGQVLFVLMNKETKIIPVQIVEEIIKRTVSSETVNYIVRVGKSGKQIQLSELDGEIFEEVEKLREVLISRVMSAMNGVVDNAVQKSNEWYEQPEVHSPLIENRQEEVVPVQFADGKIANVKIPNIS